MMFANVMFMPGENRRPADRFLTNPYGYAT
jgi:hypothetical protein